MKKIDLLTFKSKTKILVKTDCREVLEGPLKGNYSLEVINVKIFEFKKYRIEVLHLKLKKSKEESNTKISMKYYTGSLN